jgi:phosphoribosylformimino-5-aminoimidazole carboxamide ribotide isomerase
MRIIPVIDLKSGIVVRGVGGRRDEYQAVKGVLTARPSPAAVARAFIHELGLAEIYLADLDAIAGGQPSWSIYDELLALGARLWVDAGIGDLAAASRLAGYGSHDCRPARLIVGLESLPDRSMLPAMLDCLGPERLTLSIDLQSGRPLAADPRWRETPPEQIAREALRCGLRSLIVLDLAYVGENRGPGASPLCSAIRRLDANVELVSGGGVRGADDLHALAAAGCDAALVASALHDGRLTVADLEPFRP